GGAAALHARRRHTRRRARRRVRGARAVVLAADRNPVAARDADRAPARRRRVRHGRDGIRVGPTRPCEMARAAYAGNAAMKSTMRLRSASFGTRPRAAVMLSSMF